MLNLIAIPRACSARPVPASEWRSAEERQVPTTYLFTIIYALVGTTGRLLRRRLSGAGRGDNRVNRM